MNVNFYIDGENLYMRCYPRPNQICKIYLNVRIDPKLWGKRQRCLSTHPYAKEINTMIDNITKDVTTLYYQWRQDGPAPTVEAVKQLIRSKYLNILDQNINSFWNYYDIWINEKKGKISKGTLKTYQSKFSVIRKEFPDIDFHNVNKEWYMMATSHFQKKGVGSNTIRKTLSIIRTFINDAYSDGVTDNNTTRHYLPPATETEHIYLKNDHIQKMINHHYREDVHRNAVRLWLLQYCTGCRYSDIKNVIKATVFYIKEVKMLKYTQDKTGKMVSLPFNDMLNELLANPPRLIANQKLNTYIKEAAEICGLDEMVVMKNGTWPMYELVTSHTARRSCATNLVLAGVPVQMVMAVTGHSTEKQLMKYIKYDSLDTSLILSSDTKYLKVFGRSGD